ncbi:MAG: AAA family ATPase [Bacteroidales bacterium]|nr:AAA family ATPase [Bacteroidales bacterium]
MINISTSELTTILDATPAEQNVMLVGKHGIGKSEILRAYYESKGMKVIAFFLGQMSDPGDLIGLPNKDEKSGKTVFMPPYWFPTDGKPIVLFLDELNRARPEVLQTIMDLALNRRLAGRDLPAGSRIISAVNDGDEYQLTDLDPALVSRFNVYGFHPTVQEWLLWAEKSKVDERVTGFISENPDFLDGLSIDRVQIDSGLDKFPDRRAWKKVSDIIANIKALDKSHAKLLAGVVGVNAASRFLSFVAAKDSVSAKDVLLDFDIVKTKVSKLQTHELAALNEGIFRFAESTLTKEQQPTAAENLKAYIALLEKSKKKEAIAHFTNIIAEGSYNHAIAFIASKVPSVYRKLLNNIDNIG